MKKIYKYDIGLAALDDVIEVEMPFDAQVISVQNQYERLCIWAIIDDKHNTTKERQFRIVGTGHPIGDKIFDRLKFISTVQFGDGELVFHVFEVTR